MRRILGFAAVGGLASSAVLALLVAIASPAPAQTAGEHIAGYDVAISSHSTARWPWTSASRTTSARSPHHGIFRDLVERETYDAHHDRRYRINGVTVTADGDHARPVRATPVAISTCGSVIRTPRSPVDTPTRSCTPCRARRGPSPTTRSSTGTRSATSGRCRSTRCGHDRRPRPDHDTAPASPVRRAAHCRATSVVDAAAASRRSRRPGSARTKASRSSSGSRRDRSCPTRNRSSNAGARSPTRSRSGPTP